jgi:hypothetical protein
LRLITIFPHGFRCLRSPLPPLKHPARTLTYFLKGALAKRVVKAGHPAIIPPWARTDRCRKEGSVPRGVDPGE